ncbi:hypothetical protein A2276_07730 [candidate division WOR-1 bacterium RIFOXYA12_FULL_43_27]|uniref:Response regulatory domain-containing protein n=1 Tax=candidate division WOR-1 bacterium RIFOXYC2_FULL_46_14 TaxID=1802587 RepID=A0A1F4U5X5_UNCSA|nr:MAG: hypothetical protein A2276_07730 [candidate division WOR-1 bacterium RIFOXYA12_FULL_43_27]OGC20488.1 MAG: hypothetical protein A2292_05555 [candidate division WOR-1 bacterium RIFOXYB2_FULL_46_45]OGC31775.1 MAG: hypothetical protein A2232_05895 [candidate division WOR-1 bacterium RIFOXYA2_FULL_46_56]OGC40332.1 MAG: hypothetical protein A2438_03575 [candidate division WOR-1 bacterium RIFOXYC2_FULL_46_14]
MTKILVVDDEPFVVKILEDRLKKSGLEVITANDGEECLDKALQRPDLILLDFILPVMDGSQAMIELKRNESTKDIPIIVLTAMPSRDGGKKFFGLGAADFILKPIKLDLLINKIENVLKKQEAK